MTNVQRFCVKCLTHLNPSIVDIEEIRVIQRSQTVRSSIFRYNVFDVPDQKHSLLGQIRDAPKMFENFFSLRMGNFSCAFHATSIAARLFHFFLRSFDAFCRYVTLAKVSFSFCYISFPCMWFCKWFTSDSFASFVVVVLMFAGGLIAWIEMEKTF